jgi:hypothetical protein
VASPGYRWYAAAQVVSIVGTMMGYAALYWLTLRIAHGGAAALSAVVVPPDGCRSNSHPRDTNRASIRRIAVPALPETGIEAVKE